MGKGWDDSYRLFLTFVDRVDSHIGSYDLPTCNTITSNIGIRTRWCTSTNTAVVRATMSHTTCVHGINIISSINVNTNTTCPPLMAKERLVERSSSQ